MVTHDQETAAKAVLNIDAFKRQKALGKTLQQQNAQMRADIDKLKDAVNKNPGFFIQAGHLKARRALATVAQKVKLFNTLEEEVQQSIRIGQPGAYNTQECM